MTEPLLSLRGVTKSFGPVQANSGIDLDVAYGAIHAILGENGAGKSTLMKLIYGVETPDEGDIYWRGERFDVTSPAAARRLGVGMVFQHFSLFETLTVVENVSLLVPGSKKELTERIVKLGAEFGLEVDPLAHVHALSVGERQRVEIIRCLLADPKLLILDEPTSVLPPQSVELLFDTLRRLSETGVSILFISHKLEEIRSICSHATILRAGRVTGNVTPKDFDAHELAKMMIGRDMPDLAPAQAVNTGPIHLDLSNVTLPSNDPFGVSLEDISLEVRGGEILGIAGVSGNGQSELAAVISGETILPRGANGRLSMMGKDVRPLSPAARRNLGFAFVPEDRLGQGAVPQLSLVKNSILTAHGKGMVRRGMIHRTRAAEFTETCIKANDVRTPGASAEAGSLSGGNLQKFIIGRELMLEPQLLFLNQPTWGVDIGAATAIRKRLIELRNAGCAILIISEELEELFELSDYMQVLNEGHLSGRFKTSDTVPEDIGRAMIGAVEAAQ
ncbi:MAG: ABC transporter ATP-binding protein [Pseudomonadota bacterium]